MQLTSSAIWSSPRSSVKIVSLNNVDDEGSTVDPTADTTELDSDGEPVITPEKQLGKSELPLSSLQFTDFGHRKAQVNMALTNLFVLQA